MLLEFENVGVTEKFSLMIELTRSLDVIDLKFISKLESEYLSCGEAD